MTDSSDIELYKKALKREKNARKQAESLLENKAMELYNANAELKELNFNLELKLQKRLKQIQISESQFEKVVTEANDIIYKINLQGRFTYVNQAAINLTGYNQEELKTKKFSDLIQTPSLQTVTSFYLNQIKHKTQTTYLEYEIKGKNNSRYWLGQNIQLLIADGEIVGFLGIARNISDRVKADQLLRKSEEKYRHILENMELGMVEVDMNEKMTKVYDSFCKLTGYSREELLSRRAKDFLISPDSIEKMEKQIALRKKGKSSVYEIELQKKNGDFIWVLISGAPYFDDNGKVTGTIGVHLDITARKKSEEQLTKAKDLAESSSKAKELFLANMSHEIRTPLNAVIGLSQILAKTDLDYSQSGYIKTIRASAENLLSLVNNILDFSKIGSGEMELEKEPIDLLELGNNVSQLFAYEINEKNLNLKFTSNIEKDHRFEGDALRLSQVLINLVNNAIKFTEEGSIEITINQLEKNVLYFSVSDTGIGISANKVKTIFQKFRQEEESTERKYGGTGLGLNIAKSIVELYEGELEVESKKGEGSRFFFTINLPVINAVKGVPKSISKVDFKWTEYHILLVEDNKVNQFVASSFIEDWGAQLTICNNGLEACELVDRIEYDLILMDIQMPIMSGLEATHEIRNTFKIQTPIIALTANVVKEDREKYIEAGMNNYVSKPFNESELKDIIMQHLIKADKNELTKTEEANVFIDLSKLEKLSGGNTPFIIKMLKIFLKESKEQLENLRNETDHEVISAAAHKVKPSLDHLATDSLRKDVRRIEKKEFSEDWSLFAKFILDWKQLLEEIDDYLSKNDN